MASRKYNRNYMRRWRRRLRRDPEKVERQRLRSKASFIRKQEARAATGTFLCAFCHSHRAVKTVMRLEVTPSGFVKVWKPICRSC